MLKVGITERGDASIDLSWKQRLRDVDGVILITKNITDKFITSVSECDKPCIVHATCTGYGGTSLEPNVPCYKDQIANVVNLIKAGFPANMLVIRIDPIFPTPKGVHRLREVLGEYEKRLRCLGVNRIRISILDEYQHVKRRFINHDWNPIYQDRFQPTKEQVMLVVNELSRYDFMFETCAEPLLSNCSMVEEVGCVSMKDIELMGLPTESVRNILNPQNRRGCKCLQVKTELLTDKKPCLNGCVYCYWRD